MPRPLNRRKPYVTYAVMALLALLFLADRGSALLLGGGRYGLPAYLGMKINTAIAQGQYWRLLSANLFHSGLSHLVANCLGLYIWGRYIELFYGRMRYGLILLGAGLGCVALSFACSSSASLGASGMVFGLYGALLGIRKYNKEMFNAVFGAQILLYIGFSIAMGFVSGGVDNFGHIGGLLGGFLVSRVVCMLPERKPVALRLAYGAGYVVFVALCLFVGFTGVFNGI